MAISIQNFVATSIHSGRVKLNESGEVTSQSTVGSLLGRVTSWLQGKSSGINQATKNSFKQALSEQFGSQIAQQVLAQNSIKLDSSSGLHSRTIQKAVRQAMVLEASHNASNASISQQTADALKHLSAAQRDRSAAYSACRNAQKDLLKMQMAPSRYGHQAMHQAQALIDQARKALDTTQANVNQAMAHLNHMSATTDLLLTLFQDPDIQTPRSNNDIVNFGSNVQKARDQEVMKALKESGLM